MNKLPPIQITRFKDGYPCSACGACCKRIDKGIKEVKALLKERGISNHLMKFPYKWDETGKCEKLGDDGKCTVYETRPNLCRIDWITEKAKLNANTFYPILINSCNILMDEEGVDQNFRIELPK